MLRIFYIQRNIFEDCLSTVIWRTKLKVYPTVSYLRIFSSNFFIFEARASLQTASKSARLGNTRTQPCFTGDLVFHRLPQFEEKYRLYFDILFFFQVKSQERRLDWLQERKKLKSLPPNNFRTFTFHLINKRNLQLTLHQAKSLFRGRPRWAIKC